MLAMVNRRLRPLSRQPTDLLLGQPETPAVACGMIHSQTSLDGTPRWCVSAARLVA
jgi:hypothetical protein